VGALLAGAGPRYDFLALPASLSSIRIVQASEVTGVGKYRYIARLAEGGMADVFLAVTQSAGFEKLVVIKQLRRDLAQDPSFVAMFMDEARLAARLNHPNVVQTLEVGTDAATGLHFIAMEFLEGVPYHRLARSKEDAIADPRRVAFHVRVLVEVLRGLHYAHELRDFDGRPLHVVHRDVSPQNVMLTFAGGIKVLDFGIAKAALAVEQRPEDFKGKLEYMAPEQARMEVVDRRADVFSVGVMLYEAVTRRRLYRKGDDKLERLTAGQLPSILETLPTAPRRLADICARAMAADASARYPTADAMADDLEQWLLGTTRHVSVRDVGGLVATTFDPTRRKIAAAIEGQLALFRAARGVPLARLPLSDWPGPDGTGQHAQLPWLAAPHPRATGAPPLTGPHPLPAFATGAHPAANAPLTGPHPQPGFATGAYPASDRRSAFGVPFLVAASFAVVFGALALFAFVKARRPVVAAPAVAAASPAPAEISVSVKAVPAEARVTIDGRVTANPSSSPHPRDGARHVIRAEAPGYEPREETVGFERDVHVTIDLRPLPAPASASGRKPRTPRR